MKTSGLSKPSVLGPAVLPQMDDQSFRGALLAQLNGIIEHQNRDAQRSATEIREKFSQVPDTETGSSIGHARAFFRSLKVWALEVASSLRPSSDGSVDLGSLTRRWRDLFLSGSTNIRKVGATTSARLAAYVDNNVYIANNLYFDGSTWNLDDVSKTGVLFQIGPVGTPMVTVYTAPAAANPATLTAKQSVDQNGYVYIQGTKVLGTQVATPAKTSKTAGNAYTNNERDMLNELKTWQNAVDAAVNAATGHGLWA